MLELVYFHKIFGSYTFVFAFNCLFFIYGCHISCLAGIIKGSGRDGVRLETGIARQLVLMFVVVKVNVIFVMGLSRHYLCWFLG